jgi:spermidine synthase
MIFKPPRYIILVFFFLTGLAALLTQTVCASLLYTWLGYAAFAQVFVLVFYMAGMAWGATKASKTTGSPAKHLKVFGLISIFSGLFGLLAVPILQAASSISAHLGNNEWFIHLYRYLIGILLVIPPSFLSGYSFPVMLKAIGAIPNQHLAPKIYGLNALGGVMGALLAGFYLIGNIPHDSILLLVAFTFCSVGIGSLLISNKWKPEPRNVQNHEASGQLLKKLYILAFASGVAAFAMQVSLLRLLTLILGSSFRSFEILLAVYIAGMASGSFATVKHPPKKVIRFALIMAPLAGVLTLSLYEFLVKTMASALTAITRTEEGWVVYNFVTMFISSILVFLPAFFMGMLLPALISESPKATQGKTYAINALGCGIGALLAQQIGFPLLGVWHTLMLAMVFLLVMASLTLSKKLTKPSPLPLVIAFLIAGVFLLYISPDHSVLNAGVFRTGRSTNSSAILFNQDGKTASVAITLSNDKNMTLLINGKPDAAIGMGNKPGPDEPVEILLAALPLSLTQTPDNVFVIGLGSGLTAHTALCDSRVKTLEVAEIEPAVIEASRNFGHRVAKAYYDPRCTIKTGDARLLLANERKKYDLIISEPSNPWVNGMGNLFTKAFYSTVKARLTSQGVFTQWMHLYESDVRLVALVIKSLAQVFPHYSIYFADDSNILIVAGNQAIAGFPSDKIFKSNELKLNLGRIGILSANDLAFRKLGSSNWLNAYFANLDTWGASYNSEYKPLLETKAIKARFLEQNVEELHQIYASLTPVFEKAILNGTDVSPFAYRFQAIQDYNKVTANIRSFKVSIGQLYQLANANELDSSMAELNLLPMDLLVDAFHEDFISINRFSNRSKSDTLAVFLNNQIKKHPFRKNLTNILLFYHGVLINNYEQVLRNGKLIDIHRGSYSEKILRYVEFQMLLSYYKLGKRKEGSLFWHNLCKRQVADTRLQVLATLLNQRLIKSN